MFYVSRPSRQELNQILNQTRIFLHTSWNEGFGLPPAEAMACGCPVVATRSGGPADYVREGVNGWWAEPQNPQALAEVLRGALASPDLERRSAEAVRAVADRRWETVAEDWVSLVRTLQHKAGAVRP
jgi:glycosyltransferase involved in cell wall biosynthesis